MMKRYLAAALLACTINVFGQDAEPIKLPIIEGFEYQGQKPPTKWLPEGWSQEYYGNINDKPASLNWVIASGGGSPAGNENIHKPDSTHSGRFNAKLYLPTLKPHNMLLISPTIDLTGTSKPTLTFWYSQYSDRISPTDSSEMDNYEIAVCYFRNEIDTEWHVIREFSEPTDDAEPWRMSDSILLPDEVIGRNDVRIAFWGKTKVLGHGCCIDDIKIVERDTINKYINESCITAFHPTTDIIPTNSNNNVALCLRIETHGNSGTLNLKSITATALKDAAIETNNPIRSVKLYYTEENVFKIEPNNQNLLSSASIVDNKAIFNNINLDLQPGYSYIWLTCDIKNDIEHRFRNKIIDFKFEQNSIEIGNSSYPNSELSPTGERIVNEAIFLDNFDDNWTSTDWSFSGEFERAQPISNNNSYGYNGNPDPEDANSGQWMIGTNITQGNSGTYSREIGYHSYATSKTFDCTYYKDIRLVFYRWLNFGNADTATVSVSIDNGVTWQDFWKSTATITNKKWTYQNLSMLGIPDRQPNVKIRFGIAPGTYSLRYSGWNIDDVALVGSIVKYDAAVTDIITPNSGCGLSGNESITIKIENKGCNAIKNSFTVSYSINGGAWINETKSFRTDSLDRDSVLEYTFSTKANLSEPGLYDIRAKVTLEEDHDPSNDENQKSIMSQPYIDMPYSENFNTHGYWYSNNETWLHSKTSRCWTIKTIDDRYAPNNTDTLESPCFNMTKIQKPILEFILKRDIADTDGLAVYYSIDGGTNWALLPEYDYEGQIGYKHDCWNWYNTTDDNIEALGTNGWSGDYDWEKWEKIMLLMPDNVAGKPDVKLRFVFSSGDYDNIDYEGIAIDDIKIYESPVDAGVIAITPESDCHLLEEQPITISIKNFGIRGITREDSLFATATINDKLTLTDTFLLASNDTIKIGESKDFTFTSKVNMWYKKTYNMTATTLVKSDTLLFCNTPNNSKSASSEVWGEPLYDLGADKGTTDPTHTTLNGGVRPSNPLLDFIEYKWFASREAFEAGTPYRTGKELNDLRAFETNESEYYYYIKVTGEHNCIETDSIKIINSNIDVGIASISGLNDNDAFCRNKVFDDVKATVTVENQADAENTEDFKIGIGYKILDADSNSVSYVDTINYKMLNAGNNLVSNLDENYTENLGPRQTISFEYTFEQQPVFEYDGLQSIEFFTVIWADLDHSNNSITKSITVWPLPTADILINNIAYDSIPLANPIDTILVTENIDGATYLWQDNSTSNTLTISIDTTQLYEVTVVDELHHCGSATDNVLVITDNWVLSDLLSDTEYCDPQDGADITVRIENNSSNNYYAGYKIPATIKFNGNTFNEIITLSENDAENLASDSEFDYTFETKIDMPEIGFYPLNIAINPEHDINRNDNSIEYEIDIWGTPRLSIGPDTIFTLNPDTIVLSAGSEFTGCKWYDNDELKSQNLEYTPQSNLCWVYASNEHGCYADDQKITVGVRNYASDTISIVKTDLGIDRIVSPITDCNISAFNTLKLNLTNYGLDEIANGSKLPFMVKIDNNAPIRKEHIIQTTIKPGTSLLAIIPFEFNFDKNQEYNLNVWLDWYLDRFNQDDTISTVVSQYPNPAPFTLGDDIYTTNPDTVVLKAPQNYYNYSWSGGQSNSNILAINYIGTRTYGVKVSNQYGCSYSDSIVVQLTHPEIDITELGLSEELCEDNNLSTISFTLKNTGEDIIAKGSQIDIEYNINDTIHASETYKVVSTLNSGDSIAIAFKQLADFRNAASYALNITARIADTVAVSSKDYTVNVHESPKVSLGKDISTFEQSITLDAGAGFSSYLWNTGAQTEIIEVAAAGNYWVTATNEYGCQNSDTINVRMIPATVTIYEVTNPKSDCSLTDEPITIIITNNGSNTIEQGNRLDIQCTIDNDKTDSISYTLPFDFEPKMTFFKSFNGLLTINSVGIHTLTFTISIEDVEINSSTFEFEIYGEPQFKFENESITVNEYPYTLTTTSTIPNVSYLWNTNATTNAIEVTADGTYTLTVTDKHKCSATKSVTVKQNASGISSSTIADVTVYPNPANNIVNIDFDGQITNDCQILIANASGRIIFVSRQTSDIMQIAVDDWAQGIYFIKITSDNESRIIKFVKE